MRTDQNTLLTVLYAWIDDHLSGRVRARRHPLAPGAAHGENESQPLDGV